MTRTLIGLTALLLSIATWADSAYDDPSQRLHFSGFGTVGVALGHDEGADYIAGYEQASGVGRSESRDYGLDSIFGLQVDTTLFDGLSATAQMQSRRLADNTSTPYFEWANLKYQIHPDLNIRLGRVVAPMFMASEARAIGYAQTSARLPGEVYLLNPINYVDGGGITQRFSVGDALLAVNLTTGKLEQDLPTLFGDMTIDYDARMLNLALEWGNSQLRLGAARATLDFTNAELDLFNTVIEVLIAADIAGASQFKQIAVTKNFEVDFFDIGYLYDDGQWVAHAEWVARRAESYIVTDNNAFFVLAGYRINDWTPYVRYAQTNSLNDRSKVPHLDASHTGNDLLNLIAAGVNDFAVDIKTFDARESWSAGTRWDFADNLALKLQYDHVTKPAGSAGFFVNFTDTFRDTRQRLDIYSMTLDFVF